MKCKCGYNFVKARLAKGKKTYVSYALVNDKNYQRFLRAEMKVLQAPDKKSKSAAIARSAMFVGTMMKCPRCSRIRIVDPDPKSKLGESYKRDT